MRNGMFNKDPNKRNIFIDPSLLFFTADQHYGHPNMFLKDDSPRRGYLINKLGVSPDTPVDKMCELFDNELLHQHNEVVPKEGVVFNLGDFCLKGDPVTRLAAMNGTNYLLLGNHEKFPIKGAWADVIPGPCTLRVKHGSLEKAMYIFLSHYPHEEWDRSHYGIWGIHGHCHGKLEPTLGRQDVGVDVAIEKGEYSRKNPLAPYSLTELLGILGKPIYWSQEDKES
jgi:calcineurin-like phosphoesterase family protein